MYVYGDLDSVKSICDFSSIPYICMDIFINLSVPKLSVKSRCGLYHY